MILLNMHETTAKSNTLSPFFWH